MLVPSTLHISSGMAHAHAWHGTTGAPGRTAPPQRALHTTSSSVVLKHRLKPSPPGDLETPSPAGETPKVALLSGTLRAQEADSPGLHVATVRGEAGRVWGTMGAGVQEGIAQEL